MEYKSMRLEFYAHEVSYNEALDGDLVQVLFEERAGEQIAGTKRKRTLPNPRKGVGVSTNYEFPPHGFNVDWCDGEEYGGGDRIKGLELTKTSLAITLDEITIRVGFKTDDVTYEKIKSYLAGIENAKIA